VTVKEDHELIRRGPYALVRHPIYTGLLVGFIGTALVRGEWRGVLAVLMVFAALWRKLRLEERWMSETFGDQYRDYRQHTAALIPFLL
jgi:protein-S-isoprenylcysteine O-methyltransferase Ste14